MPIAAVGVDRVRLVVQALSGTGWSYTTATIATHLPRSRLKCVAILGVASPWIRGEAAEGFTHASASVVRDPGKPVSATCEPL